MHRETATAQFLLDKSNQNAILEMATNQQRRELFNSLEQVIGTNNADFVMELLPNQPADQLVTKTDLSREMGALRSELKGEMAELRGEMNIRFATAKVETQRLIIAGMVANAIAVLTALLT